MFLDVTVLNKSYHNQTVTKCAPEQRNTNPVKTPNNTIYLNLISGLSIKTGKRRLLRMNIFFHTTENSSLREALCIMTHNSLNLYSSNKQVLKHSTKYNIFSESMTFIFEPHDSITGFGILYLLQGQTQ